MLLNAAEGGTEVRDGPNSPHERSYTAADLQGPSVHGPDRPPCGRCRLAVGQRLARHAAEARADLTRTDGAGGYFVPPGTCGCRPSAQRLASATRITSAPGGRR